MSSAAIAAAVQTEPVQPPAQFRPLPVEGHLPGFDGATGWLNSRRSPGRTCTGRSCSSTSGPTPASTGCARSATSAPGPRSTRIRAWSWSASTRPSSRSSATSTTSARPRRTCGVEYPVALDSDYAIWQAFANHYWPAVYIADAEGRIRHHHFGEGGYEECERVIQRLLRGGRRRGHPRRSGLGRRRWFRGAGRLGEPGVARDVPRLRASRALCVARWRRRSTSLGPTSCRTS